MRNDDPSDVIPHEHRRDLRGARVLAAWLNHFDSREQNSMATFMEDKDLAKEQKATEHRADDKDDKKKDGEKKHSKEDEPKEAMRGHIRHWYIDFGDSFGSEWSVDGFSRRHGQSYILDFPYLVEDFLTLGIPERPWDRARRAPEAPSLGYFSERDLDPDVWRNEYPNPAFTNIDEGDGAWAARIIARFTPSQVAALVDVGNFTSRAQRDYLLRVLLARQGTILRRYFSKLSPITDIAVEPERLCAVDLARKTNTWSEGQFRYRATVTRGTTQRSDPLTATAEAGGRLCLPLTSTTAGVRGHDDDPSRYIVVRITNGVAPGAVVLHLYDLGQRGLVLVGIERPEA